MVEMERHGRVPEVLRRGSAVLASDGIGEAAEAGAAKRSPRLLARARDWTVVSFADTGNPGGGDGVGEVPEFGFGGTEFVLSSGDVTLDVYPKAEGYKSQRRGQGSQRKFCYIQFTD